MQTEQVSVTSTAARLDVANYRLESIGVRNIGAVDCYLGNAGVTSSNGFLLSAGESQSVDLGSDDVLWAVTASGTTTVAVMHAAVS